MVVKFMGDEFLGVIQEVEDGIRNCVVWIWCVIGVVWFMYIVYSVMVRLVVYNMSELLVFVVVEDF